MKPQTGKVRCIDIVAYKRSHQHNQKVLDISDNEVIEITRVSPSSCGYTAHPNLLESSVAISPGEWKYFEPVSKYPNPPHKHAELIKAWADGAEIEVEREDATGRTYWIELHTPSFNKTGTYRIKPQKSEKDIQIEKLEEQAKQLAIDIAKLKET